VNKRKIIAFAVGPLASAALTLITLPIITWFYSAEDIGRISMLQVVVNLVVLLFTLGLDQAYIREYHEVANKQVLFKASMVPGFLLLTIFLLLCLFFPGWISDVLFKIDSQRLSLLVSLCLVAAFISRFLSLILRMQERGLAFSMSQMLPKLLFLVVIGTLVSIQAKHSLLDLVIAHTASFIMVTLVFAWNTRKDWHGVMHCTIDWKQLGKMLKFGAPLIFGGLTSWGMMVSDKLFLRNFSSFAELGIFSVAVSFASVAVIFQSIFSTVWVPTVYKWAAEGINIDKIDQVTESVLALVVFLFSLCGLFSWLIQFFLPAKYNSVQYIVVACMACPLFYTLSETTVVGIGVSRRSSLSMTASFAAFIVCLITNFIFVPRYGASGASIASAIAFWCFFFFRTELAIIAWRPLPRLKLYGPTLICLVAATAFARFGPAHHGLFRVSWSVMLIAAGVLFRRLVAELVREAIAEAEKFINLRQILHKIGSGNEG
jgi:O-antigen/teichoic acid export membrane protein